MKTELIGKSELRIESWNKVTGRALYNEDYLIPGALHAKMVTSSIAHGWIKSIDTSEALNCSGVQAVITGRDFPVMTGPVLADRPPIAIDKVRYYGEPVAVVIASSEFEAAQGAQKVKMDYEQLPAVNSVNEALKKNAQLVHENLGQYKHVVKDIYPEENTNIANRVKIRKGNIDKGWVESELITELKFVLPQTDHTATETRSTRAKINPDGRVFIYTSTQAPFSVSHYISKIFNIPEGDVIVKTPLVGGAFGGKACVQLEYIAYMASKIVNGKMVRVANTREEDLITSPARIGLEARVKLGASLDGRLKAAELTFLVDTGAYTDTGPRIAKAIAVDCTGPYNIENVHCDTLCVYTNHPYVTSYRGFGHLSYTFCIERTMDKLAYELGIDPLELRLKNTLNPGDYTPTMVKLNRSTLGNLPKCLKRVKELINWDDGIRIVEKNNLVRAKGLAAFWKTSDSPPDASSGVIITFNKDGGINLNCGAVEFGPGMKTSPAQILADRLKMDIKRIHVVMNVDTQISPEHWKTVASMTTFMVGQAVLKAADDLIEQLLERASTAMRCPAEDLEVGGERVYLKSDPAYYIKFVDLVHGFKYPNGNSIGGQIIGRGSFIMRHLTLLDKETGAGKPGPYWTPGAQAVEIFFNPEDYTYRLLKAVTVIDAGKVINPKIATGLLMGGMKMGLGMSSRESFDYGKDGAVLNNSLRTYKTIHFAENPEYQVDFVETPEMDAPYGARGLAEHGIIGMPAALANALSSAAGVDLTHLPLTPEYIWQIKTGGQG